MLSSTFYKNFVTLIRPRGVLAALCTAALSCTFAAAQEPISLINSTNGFQPIVAPDAGVADVIEAGLRLKSVQGNENAWDVQVGTRPIKRKLLKGEVVEFSFEGRSVESNSPDNTSLATVYFAKSEPWELINASEATIDVSLSDKWKTFHCVARAENDFDADSVIMTMHCGAQRQTIEVRNMKLNFWGNVASDKLPFNKIEYVGQNEDAEWRSAAQKSIRENRMSPVAIRVTNTAGEPVVGARVHLKQRTHSYAFGSFTDAMPLKSGVDAERYRKTMRQYFNRVTLPRYFADWGTDSPQGKITADNMANWAASEGYQLKTHLLLYPQYLPDRVVALQKNPEAFQKEIEIALDDALARTAHLPMHAWDAINELRTSSIVADVLGEAYYASVFNRGHAAQPNAKWFINEFDVIESSPSQQQSIELYESTIQKILDNGGKLSGIGFQGHFSEVLTPIPKVLEILDRFAKFGVPLEITEFDINTRDEEGQADYTRDLLTAFFSHPATTGFTCWGFWEGSIWRPHGAMIRKDWSTKLNAKAWNELVKKEWWTDETALTDGKGMILVPAFHGRYQIEIETDNDYFSKDIQVEKGPQNVNVSLPNS